MFRQLNGDQCCIWSFHKASLYMTLAQTDRQTDRRSSSRFSAYLFFQRAFQTVEKHLMQTDKGSECCFLTSSALVSFYFVFRERVNFRVYDTHNVTRKVRRSGKTVIYFSHISPFPRSGWKNNDGQSSRRKQTATWEAAKQLLM